MVASCLGRPITGPAILALSKSPPRGLQEQHQFLTLASKEKPRNHSWHKRNGEPTFMEPRVPQSHGNSQGTAEEAKELPTGP